MAFATTPEVRARMRNERRARGWDIPRLAQELRNVADHPYKMPSARSLRRYIERWEDGQVVQITERYRILYARALNMSMSELFEDGPAQPLPPEAVSGDVDAIRVMLNALMASDRQFGGRRLRQQAADYLADVIEPRLRGSVSGSLRESLFSVGAEFTLRVSAMHLDTDQIGAALSLLGRASSMAAESGDPTLTAWTLSRRGEHELHQAALATRPALRDKAISQAIDFSEGAAAVARTAPPVGRAFITTKLALAWSMTGDRAKTQRVLGQVWDAYDRAGTAEEPAWMGAYGVGHLRHEEARCYVNLGMGRDAVRAATESLAVRRDLRPRAFTLGVLAIGHAQTLEVEQACAAGRQLIELAPQITSRRVCMRVGEVLRALQPFERDPSVAELRHAAQPVLQGCGC